MKKGIICYQSKYGATLTYVKWLQETLHYDVKELKSVKLQEILAYDTILICGGIYASGIKGINFLKKHYEALCHKRLIVFCVGASPYDEKAFQNIKQTNLKDRLKDIPLFYGRGAWDERKMTFIDRKLCHMLQKAIAKKDPSTYEPWMTALSEVKGKSANWCDKKYIQPLITYLNETEK